MKVLVSDPIHEAGIKTLREVAEVEVATGLSEGGLMEKVKDADALLVRSATKVTKEVIDQAKNLKVIGRAGVGVDNINVEAATERGIAVVNAPESSTITVAEHTMGMILALARRIPFADASVKVGRWEKRKFLGIELRGKTLGIIGLGRIGSQVAQKSIAFGMHVIAYDPYIPEKTAKKMGVDLVSIDKLVRNSDFVTVHAPLTERTKGIIGRKEIAKMKDGVFLINCARGGIIDEKALYKALKSGKVAGAAIDVFEEEPPIDNPLLEMENVIVTPHLGASTEEAQRNASTMAVEGVLDVLQNRAPKYVVNMPVFAPEVLEELKDYLPLAGKMGRFLIQLIGNRINDVSITYCGELSEVDDLGVLTNSILMGLLTPILTGSINLLNAPLVAKKRGIRITEGKREDAEEYQNMIILNVKTERAEIELKGTMFGGEEARIVGINGYKVDLVPAGRILLVKHEDRPGMIGAVASSLGKHKINIGFMQVGRKERGGIQLMVLKVDQTVPEEVLNLIGSIDGIKEIKSAEL
ncbi:MAG: phosphoglycerate dehydrogenase [Candidatus Hydrothermarchaeales archaeon]